MDGNLKIVQVYIIISSQIENNLRSLLIFDLNAPGG